MKNATIIFSICAILFLIFGAQSHSLRFYGLCFAWIVGLLCLIKVFGLLKGAPIFIIYSLIPGAIESFGYDRHIWGFTNPSVQSFIPSDWYNALSLGNIMSVIIIAVLFIGALFFAKKINAHIRVTKANYLLVAVIASVFGGINSLYIAQGYVNYTTTIRWVLIALVINLVLSPLFTYKKQIPELFSAIPVLLYFLTILNIAVMYNNVASIIIFIVSVLIYVGLLIKERQYKKLFFSQAS